MSDQLLSLQLKLTHIFRSPELLIQALTHKSHAPNSQDHNEKLEFIGDSVLDLALSEIFMQRLPSANEGELSKIRASLVNESALNELALEIGLQHALILGKGERQAGGAMKPRLLASALEAVIGALFFDAGYETAKSVIEIIFRNKMNGMDMQCHYQSDFKTRLQEMLQADRRPSPVYEVVDEVGPDHEKVFSVELKINNESTALGRGRTKKQAEQEAARQAIELIAQSTVEVSPAMGVSP